ncbi:MAG: DinB family protein [Bacteroidota bacterium]
MEIRNIRNQYDLQSRLFNNVMKEVTDENALKRLSDNTNNFAWIAAHTLDLQYNIAMMTGIATENPYAEHFSFGKPFDPDIEFPTMNSLLNDWNGLTPKIQTALAELNEEQLNGELPFPIPFAEQTLKGFLAFQMHHLGYEIGQLGLLRKYLGYDAMSYQL